MQVVMGISWQPDAEELAQLRTAIVKSYPALTGDEGAIDSMVERVIAFTCRWEGEVPGPGTSEHEK